MIMLFKFSLVVVCPLVWPIKIMLDRERFWRRLREVKGRR